MNSHQDALIADVRRPARSLVPAAPGALLIVAYGNPVAQGSKRLVTGRGGVGRPHMIDNNDRQLRPWRDNLRAAATTTLEDWALPRFARGVPVELGATFTFARPRSHFGTGRNFQVLKAKAPDFLTTIPDVDKLLRALDALTDAGVWDDDRQVCAVTAVKVYVGGPSPDALDIPGAVIRVRAL